MWLTEKMRRHLPQEKTSRGVVSGGGRQTRVLGEREFICAATVFPFGVYSVVPKDARAVVLDGLCLGVTNTAEGLEEGEICLYSRGGASIVLRNSGDVEINGQVFHRQEG